MQMVKLLRREEVAEGSMSFYFEKPPGFQFKPGQYVDCTLIDPQETDAQGNIRSLSLTSAPAEKDLMVATRMRGTAFKRVLKTMALGSQLQIEGPLGSFTLHSTASRPAVFLAGGIGITPFRSMIVNAAREGKLGLYRLMRGSQWVDATLARNLPARVSKAKVVR
jgi:ferredoxin-NADP reductase